MANVFDVAKYILVQMEELKLTKERMTTLKLQKLVYYAQAWSLVWDSEPLFKEEIEAWANGPVVPELFNAHRGKLYITSKAMKRGNIEALSEEQRTNIDNVLKFYGSMTSHYLSDLTHMEAPWKDARIGIPKGKASDNKITPLAMKSYYESL